VNDPEGALAQALRELVASGAAERGEFSPADARKAARRRLAPFSDRRRRYRRPRSPAVRVGSVLVVAALIVAVFVAPWPDLHLFGAGSVPRAADPYVAMPVVAESGSPTCRPVSSATDGGAGPALSDVQFVSRERGWVVGAGRILATTDAGRSWQVQYRGPADLIEVDFVDSDHGFAVGTDQLLATEDGGGRWSELGEPCPTIRAVDFTSSSSGFAVASGTPNEGGTYEGGELLVTIDGGRQWRRDTRAPTGVQSLSFATRQAGWVATPGRVWHTTDGGLHWRLSFTEPASHPTVSSYPGDTALVECGGAQGAWVLFLGAGAATGHFPYVAFATRDGHDWHSVLEESFTEQGVMPEVHAPDGPGTYPGPFSAVSSDTAVFVGFNPPAPLAPMDVATDNGMKLSSHRYVTGIWDPVGTSFVSADRGWVIGLTGGSGSASAIEMTADGGRTWTLQWSSSAPRRTAPATQKTVAADAPSYPALTRAMVQPLQAQNDGEVPVLVPHSSDREAIPARRAVEAATTYPVWKGARVVATGLARVRTGVGGATHTAWLVLIDPPGPHTCTSYGPGPLPASCHLNLYVVAVDARSGGVLWSGDLAFAPLGPLPVFTGAG